MVALAAVNYKAVNLLFVVDSLLIVTPTVRFYNCSTLLCVTLGPFLMREGRAG